MEDLQFQNLAGTRRLIALLLTVSLGAALFISCSLGDDKAAQHNQAADKIPAVTVLELRQLVDAGEDIYLLDVRRDSEFVAERLTFTDLRVTHDSLEFNLDRLPLDKTTGIYCFCRGGVRSARAASYLLSIGYTKVYNVTGGMLAWKENDFETLSGPVD
jgi:rhodanese-related sulfurtransferase